MTGLFLWKPILAPKMRHIYSMNIKEENKLQGERHIINPPYLRPPP